MGASNSNQNRTFYKLKVDKDSNVPMFLKQKKDSNGIWVVDETFNQITGYLQKVELSNYVYEGDTIDTLKFNFLDDEDSAASFSVETGLNYLSRSILNSLAGADQINHVKIRVYTTKAKDNSGKVFPQAYLEINRQKADWKYKPDEVPKAKEVKVGGKTLKDTTEVDEFFKLLIPEINSKIIADATVDAAMNYKPQNGAKQKTGELVPDNLPDDSSDLPF